VKYNNTIIYLIVILLLLSINLLYCQEKLAQTGFQFLSVTSDARATAMGEAMTSIPGYSGALFFNPASLAEIPTVFNATFSLNSWIADINHTTFSMAFKPASGQYGVIGLSIQSVDYGDLQGTMVWDNFDGYIDTETFSPSAISMGIGYAKTLSNKFAVGGQVKINYQNLGKNVIPSDDGYVTKRNVTDGIAYDFGTLFKTGYKSLAFGMFVRNYSNEVKFETEDFQTPLLFSMGISANVFDWISVSGPRQALINSILDMVALRSGYIFNNDEENISFGLGLATYGVELDYAYTPFGVFDSVQRITARLSL